MPVEPKVTEEQANEALMALMAQANQGNDDDAPVQSAAPEPVEAKSATAPEAAAPAPVDSAEPAPATEAQSDDVESLKVRLKESEDRQAAIEKRAADRVAAIQSRHSQNEQIIRQRMLQKATAADRALKTLKQTRTQAGASEQEVDEVIRFIEGTINPQSASYAPPAPAMNQEDQAIVLNNFLNEKGMDGQEADEFGKWMRNEAGSKMSPIEQELAGRDLDGFLRLAHVRFGESVSEKQKATRQNDAVDAVRSVQRTQKEAARAASSSPAAPRKSPTAPAVEPDYKKMTKADVSALLRQSVEQYR